MFRDLINVELVNQGYNGGFVFCASSDPMVRLDKQLIAQAISQAGFDDWTPRVDVPHLNRPRARPKNQPGEGRIAAVLILLYPNPVDREAELQLVLTKRHSNLSKHGGQISFPGGRRDPGETLDQTALRETFEEIGIPSDQIELLGHLNSVYIPPSDFTVTPYVGWFEHQPDFVRSTAEVDEIIVTSLAHLLDPTTLVFGDVQTEGGKLPVPFYQVGTHQVWGATAIMVSELIDRLNQVID